ncbi:hypothetical protein SAMN05421839_102136 [Halolactibacillus halophilus]|uniref:Hook-length control protein FliK n=1 Tax=Halolactibacillus halophilus TaxID=306540 RepID=A0A1I5LLX5_9BACI|nr:hypothetical protein [Halolactibacillus halophilus]GEM00755.1 hypothetical protein HHA03_02870 [Halolactibacillus halophilus]SFO98389.1 hypothetical protein SAMN05421839_102136 [Halolactibacillus halophilus]
MQVQSQYKSQALKHQQAQTKLALSKGQIVKGTIEQLHPDQMATIKMGNQSVAAKLEVPVEKGQSYVFEVTSSGEIPELKMIEQQVVKQEASLGALLKNMGVPVTKEAEQLLRQLLSENIPVKPSQFKAALAIYKAHPEPEIKNVLMSMVKHQIPLSSETVTSFARGLADSTSLLVDQLMQTLNELVPSDKLTQLMQQLSMVKTPVASPDSAIFALTDTQMEQIMALFNQKGIQLTQGADVPNALKQLLESQLGVNEQTAQQLKQWVALERLPLNQQERLMFLKQNQAQINTVFPDIDGADLGARQSISKEIIQAVVKASSEQVALIQKSPSEQMVGMEKLHTFLKEHPSLLEKVTRQLPVNQQQGLQQFMDRPTAGTAGNIKAFLTQLFDQQLTQTDFKALTPLVKETNLLQTLPVEQQFLVGVKDFLLQSGLTYEQQLLDSTDISVTLKQLLLDVQQSSEVKLPAIDQLIQSLTDQQLSIVRQDEHFIHYGVALPITTGEDQEVYLEMYGQKETSGELNPDYCHVAFYLTLGSLGETIVDMAVQNRTIQVTVINNQEVANLLEPLKPSLKDGLARLDYHLTSLHHRPFKDKEPVVNHHDVYKKAATDQKRWDMRA